MSHSRLPFLYPPVLFSSARKLLNVNSTAARTLRCVNTHVLRPAAVVGSRIPIRARHGKAVEPPEFQKQQQQQEQQKPGEGIVGETDPAGGERKADDGGSSAIQANSGTSVGAATSPATSSTETATSSSPPSTPAVDIIRADPISPPPSIPPSIPHLFDTYTLVHRLYPTFTLPQSIAAMHLLRTLLNEHVTTTQSTLLSRSTFENTNYLFRAASGELRSEISALRATQLEKMRQERAQVQREFELLNGRFMEELMVCGNELRGMFNDRKMVNKSELREVENKIQELNYKITVLMGSELKSEVEKLRWVTTRRGLIAIGLLAAFIVSFIKFSQNNQKREKEKAKAKADAAAAAEQFPNEFGNGHGHGAREIPIDGLVHTTGPVPTLKQEPSNSST